MQCCRRCYTEKNQSDCLLYRKKVSYDTANFMQKSIEIHNVWLWYSVYVHHFIVNNIFREMGFISYMGILTKL